MIDKTFLPEALPEGFQSEFAVNGHLRHFGAQDKGWQLHLVDGTAYVEKTDRVHWDAEDQSLEEFARYWIDTIVAQGGYVRQCAFCEKQSHEVKKLIAGPSVTICDECVALCAEIVAAEPPVI